MTISVNKMNELDNILSFIKRTIMRFLEPIVIGGIVTGLSFYLFERYAFKMVFYVILPLSIIGLILETYLKRKYTNRCSECGRFYKNKK